MSHLSTEGKIDLLLRKIERRRQLFYLQGEREDESEDAFVADREVNQLYERCDLLTGFLVSMRGGR